MAEKTVLMCYKERKRPVVFQSDGKPECEKERLVAAARQIFQDMLPADEDYTLAVQCKSESWYGNFVELKDELIEDKAVVQLVVEVSRCFAPVFVLN